MKSFLPGIIALLLAATPCYAQLDHQAVGARMTTDGGGVSWKAFLNGHYVIETQITLGGLRYMDGRSITATGLIEYHLPLPFPRLRVFFGGGMHFGRWTDRESPDDPDELTLGLDGIGGVEYLFPKSSWAISGDLKPALNYIETVEFFPHGMFGFGARYYFDNNRFRSARKSRS